MITLTGQSTIELGQGSFNVGIGINVGGFNASYQASLNGAARILKDLADGDIGHITFSNNISNMTVGKNGNAIIAKDEKGRMGEMVIRVLRGSADEAFLGRILQQYINDSVAFVTLNGAITAYFGDGNGTITSTSYALQGGTISKKPEMTVNVNGNTEQAISVWTIQGLFDEIYG